MRTAFFTAVVGTIIGFIIAMGYFHWTALQALRCVVAGNLSGTVCALTVLELERFKFIKKYFFTRIATTWIYFAGSYFIGTLILAPELRSVKSFALMSFPVLLSTGFCIIFIGPIRDKLVHSRQRSERAKT